MSRHGFNRRNARAPRDVPWFPPEQGDARGLVGVGGDLTVPLLRRAYSEGVFPWYNDGDPILWWSPDPRGIIPLDGFHIAKRLARTIRSGKFRVTVNQCFRDVMQACGAGRPEGTWITDDMLDGYTAAHAAGLAHSLEVWCGETLAGGIYGIAIGGLFAGESMFHRVTDASKVALAALVERLRTRGFVLFDVQMQTEHTATMGAIAIPRADYLQRLRTAITLTHVAFAD